MHWGCAYEADEVEPLCSDVVLDLARLPEGSTKAEIDDVIVGSQLFTGTIRITQIADQMLTNYSTWWTGISAALA